MNMTRMKRTLLVRTLVVLTLVAGLAWLGGCVNTAPSDAAVGGGIMEQPTGSKLFQIITETDPYQGWAQFPEAQGTVPSSAPHGQMARIFINERVAQAINGSVDALPDGSIIVKENIGDASAENTEALTVMWKVAGFNPDGNDWFWVNVTPDGQINAEGAIASCLACHTGAADNDFLFTHQLAIN